MADVIVIVVLPKLAGCYCHIYQNWQMLLPCVLVTFFVKQLIWLFLWADVMPYTICDRCCVTLGVVYD